VKFADDIIKGAVMRSDVFLFVLRKTRKRRSQKHCHNINDS